jgi:amidase
MPAACCGVVGLKPSFGRLSRQGVQPGKSELDCVGLIAKNIALIEGAMRAIDSEFQLQSEPSFIHVGVIWAGGDSRVCRAFGRFLRRLKSTGEICVERISLSSLESAFEAGVTLMSVEALAAYGDLRQDLMGVDVASRIKGARAINASDIDQAEAIKQRFTLELDAVFDEVDIILLPTLPDLPMTRKAAMEGGVDLLISKYVRPFNVSGNPAVSIPIEGGDPISVQLVAPIGKDEYLCAVARRLNRIIEKTLGAPFVGGDKINKVIRTVGSEGVARCE